MRNEAKQKNIVITRPSVGKQEQVGYHGADAVHSHMTNTRITAIEILKIDILFELKDFQFGKIQEELDIGEAAMVLCAS